MVLIVGGGATAPVWIGTVIMGAATAPQFPAMMNLAEQRIHVTGAATTWFVGGAGLGGLIFPWLIGQWFDDERGHRAAVGDAGVRLAHHAVVHRRCWGPGHPPSTGRLEGDQPLIRADRVGSTAPRSTVHGRIVEAEHPGESVGTRPDRRHSAARQWLAPSVAACNCASTASRLNDAGSWRGGYSTKSWICSATMPCILYITQRWSIIQSQ